MFEQPDKKPYRVFSLWLRIFHWTMVLCVTFLFWTGLYIGDPGFSMFVGREPAEAINSWFSMEMIRRVHFGFAFVLIFAFVFRIYGAIRYRGDRLLPKFRSRLYWDGLKQTTLHYLMLPRQEEHRVLRNSLARTSYLLVYIMMFLEICTGLAMYSQINPNSWLAIVFNPINLMFNEYDIHIVHHYIAWFFLLFTVAHVYLAFREDVMEESGEVSSMVSGMKFYPEDPEDIEDLYGKRQ
ncbi:MULTISPECIES: Ni/Fe-hydrogenase, b-type cytochrome subunit [unclassified Veillonella]|uniref:Ni/Fe-hydrogenase, b-type cytochrome subunit n=1 Tax=unclassified Veillonella TaxID=2630086 RepID=UPI00138A357B|nr:MULTISPECIES: Ni/Fe-hydrogenase, b-type cytochrome subunit [unclassified Veillonella]KAF1682223.1 Ni/Fe-hydrogenase, b-type cytochrome subunit [Veillonella sp. R32]